MTMTLGEYKEKFQEVNDLEFAGFKFDLFETESGALGITVYNPTNNERCIDIFVNRDLSIIYG